MKLTVHNLEQVLGPNAVLPVLIHGDAAFPGQGMVAETLNLQSLAGYSTGGTLHVIANNQLGFTTDPDESRSTRYASDLAKGFDVPIIHVNADDVEGCVASVRLALGYRDSFRRDALVDLIGYRRFGHNETDEPAYTQPLMYDRIKQHPPVRTLYARRLAEEGTVPEADAEPIAAAAYQAIADAHAELKRSMGAPPDTGQHELDRTMSREPRTDVAETTLRRSTSSCFGCRTASRSTASSSRSSSAAARPSTSPTAGSTGPRRGAGVRVAAGARRPRAAHGPGHRAGHLQPAPRGAARPGTGERWCALQHLRDAVAPFELHNSPLSSGLPRLRVRLLASQAPDALVLWEAQFGDFVNAAQVIVDQFLVSGLAKWGQTSAARRCCCPTATRGQGPEHSSARLERFLQAARRGQHPGGERHDAGPVLPPAAPPGAGVQAAAAGRDDAQEPAAPPGGHLDGAELAEGGFSG